MIPVRGRPFVAHQLQLLYRQGVREVVMCVGHLSSALVEYVGDGAAFNMHVQYSHDGDKLLGTGGAVLKASRLVSSPFALIYGDSYLDTDFAPILAAFERSNKHALMTLFRNENRYIPSNIEFEDGLIVDYNKDQPTAAMHYVDYGLSIFRREAFEAFDQHEPLDLSVITLALIKNRQLAGYEIGTRFYEVGSPDGLRDLEAHLAKC
jgi:NDP-sugar pyrophosphorylase family protein